MEIFSQPEICSSLLEKLSKFPGITAQPTPARRVSPRKLALLLPGCPHWDTPARTVGVNRTQQIEFYNHKPPLQNPVAGFDGMNNKRILILGDGFFQDRLCDS